MTKINALIITMLISMAGYSQNISDMPANSFPYNLGGNTVMQFKSDNEMDGYRTLLQDFCGGVVLFTDGKRYSNVLINYDAFGDNLIAKTKNIAEPIVVRSDLVVSFSMVLESGDTLKFEKTTIDGKVSYLQKLSNRLSEVYCSSRKIIRHAESEVAYNVNTQKKDAYVPAFRFYFKNADGSLTEFSFGKKAITRKYPELEKSISAYWKTYKPSSTDMASIRDLFRFIASLKK